MTTLHDKILSLPCEEAVFTHPENAYRFGHYEARHSAAELAVEQDALVAQLVEALEYTLNLCPPIENTTLRNKQARAALARAKEMQ